MGNFFRSIIRASSFFRKEIFEIWRQPRLVAILVLGPFLILFIFGIGYRAQSPALRTLFVVQSDSAISAEDIELYGKSMGKLFTYAGITDDQSKALGQLQRGQVDLVIVVPTDAISTIRGNQQAVFALYHHEIDPIQVNYINYMGWRYVSEVNQQVLLSFVVQGQEDTVNLPPSLQEAHQNVAAMRQAVQSGNEKLALQEQQALASNVDTVSQAIGASLILLDSLQQATGPNGANTASMQNTLTDLQQNTNQLGDRTGTKDERLATLDKVDKDITDMEAILSDFQSIDPLVIISPFRSEVKSVANFQPTLPDFFAPSVLALLLQHLAVTFAALSIVRERHVGTMELFRVSPLSAAEALLGKYISYMVFGGLIAAALTVLLVFGLKVPMLGNWWYFTLVIAAVLFTSLGIGFTISMISETDSQAVQYSMMILLAGVFFGGFIMSLEMLWEPVRVISWLLPTTYGTLLLRDIALRGFDLNWSLLGALTAIGLVLMLISWWLMRRLIASPK